MMGEGKSRTVFMVLGGIAAMSVLVIKSPELYRTFCQITGWGGTTQRTMEVADEVLDRQVKVRFDGSTSAGLPWDFRPEQVSQTVHLGETGLAYYEATNTADYPVIGTASFNVQPAKAGRYFQKIECFCFTEQLLQPGESMSMPVTYFVDPAMDEDASLDEVIEITLSYTFHRNEGAEQFEFGETGTGGAP